MGVEKKRRAKKKMGNDRIKYKNWSKKIDERKSKGTDERIEKERKTKR